ncbi:MAG TPA: glycosyltransferase family 4 protein [Opitutus sp.]|nr:glycosyltransferase family 4 protein [Opitutus sp.]
MKITILQGAFLPVPARRGGAVEKMWFGLGPEFVAHGHEVTHISRLCDGLPATGEIGGVRHVRIRGYDRPARTAAGLVLDFLYARRAARAAPDADVIVTNSFWAPLVLKARSGALYVDVQRMPKGQMRLYRRAARLRANSSAVADAIAAEAPQMMERVRVIPNPLPFVPARPVDWTLKDRTVLFVGRIHPEKGIELLLDAWLQLRRAGRLDGWRLELIGPVKSSEGGGGETWAAELRHRFAAADIAWRAPIYDADELNRAYERAAVFAYPSLAAKGETFGLAVLEAMAWGAVPIVSELACFRDFVTTQRNGVVFDHLRRPVPALAEALEQAARPESRALGERAVAVRETHSTPAVAKLFLDDFAALARRTTFQ